MRVRVSEDDFTDVTGNEVYMLTLHFRREL